MREPSGGHHLGGRCDAATWFVTIHPFDDGNGRIGRAIAEMALSRADGTTERYYSMSSAIEARRKEYYRQLESGQGGGLEITAWMEWFLSCLDRTSQHADEQLASVLFKARLWQRINEEPVNVRQRTIINRLLGDFEGHLTTSKYARIATCSNDTALRDIRELLARSRSHRPQPRGWPQHQLPASVAGRAARLAGER